MNGNEMKMTKIRKIMCTALFVSIGMLFLITALKVYRHLSWEKSFMQNLLTEVSYLKQENDNKDKEIEELKMWQAELQASMSEINIVCWGDSLTAGAGGDGTSYPSVIQELSLNDGFQVNVVNMGVGGENTHTILARGGGTGIRLEECLIPSDTEPVEVSFSLADGKSISPLRQGDGGISRCSINGIDGILSIEQESYTSAEYKYYFTRLEPGEECLAEKGTYLINEGSYLYRGYIPVIFIGQNGSWESPEDLIAQQESLLDTLDNPNKYIIVGLTSGSEEERSSLEEAMEIRWGIHYVNLRNYLSKHGLSDAGIVPSESDKEQMEKGIVPDSLRVDKVHFNKTGYQLIGEQIYKRMIELHYIQ